MIVHPDFVPFTSSLVSLPEAFRTGAGECLKSGRNVLRRFAWTAGGRTLTVVVKEFGVPHLLNRIVYGTLRESKAQRSYEYALRLLRLGIGTPQPVAWATARHCGLLGLSYYASVASTLPYTFAHLILPEALSERVADTTIPVAEQPPYLKAVGRLAARLHDAGILHADFSRGNILLGMDDAGEVRTELVDLNRLRFRSVSLAEGEANLMERLPMTPWQREVVLTEYRAQRR